MANKEPTLAPADVYSSGPRRRGGAHTFLWVVLVLIAALGGFVAGQKVDLRSLLGDGSTGIRMVVGKTSIAESELDEVVATYDYNGEVVGITAREAIAQESSLDAVRNADGSYAMPSAESILSAARTSVLVREVQAHGIEVSDEELSAYALDTFGTDDMASLAASYTMDEAEVRERVRESCGIAKLRAAVVTAAPAEPAAPAQPENGDVNTASADYAAYIIALAGAEWDGEKGTWVSDEGVYANALKAFDVRSDSATYEAAQTAYNVAYQQHSDALTAATTQWSEYVNGLLCKAELTLGTIVT